MPASNLYGMNKYDIYVIITTDTFMRFTVLNFPKNMRKIANNYWNISNISLKSHTHTHTHTYLQNSGAD